MNQLSPWSWDSLAAKEAGKFSFPGWHFVIKVWEGRKEPVRQGWHILAAFCLVAVAKEQVKAICPQVPSRGSNSCWAQKPAKSGV